MATEYNISFLDNSTNLANIFIGINTASNNYLAIMFLVVIYVIFAILLKDNGMLNSLLFSGVITTIVSILFMGLGMVNITVFGICLALTIITVFISFMSR